jgi:hypothetical protein
MPAATALVVCRGRVLTATPAMTVVATAQRGCLAGDLVVAVRLGHGGLPVVAAGYAAQVPPRRAGARQWQCLAQTWRRTVMPVRVCEGQARRGRGWARADVPLLLGGIVAPPGGTPTVTATMRMARKRRTGTATPAVLGGPNHPGPLARAVVVDEPGQAGVPVTQAPTEEAATPAPNQSLTSVVPVARVTTRRVVGQGSAGGDDSGDKDRGEGRRRLRGTPTLRTATTAVGRMAAMVECTRTGPRKAAAGTAMTGPVTARWKGRQQVAPVRVQPRAYQVVGDGAP